MLFDVLPEEIAPDITQESIGPFIDHARLLKEKAPESFLTLRVLKVLEHFRVRNSNPEAATVLSTQSDVDAKEVQASYTLLRIFIWAIPLMLLMSAMQKAEEDVLNTIDEFCTENLLKRLNERTRDRATEAGSLNLVFSLRQAMEEAFAAHRDGMDAWSGQTLKAIHEIQDKLAALQKEQVEQLKAASESAGQSLARTLEQADVLRGYVAGLTEGLAPENLQSSSIFYS